ncbi:uncharacterized protein LOC141619680 isoform X3 [Silene latifolia]|uniref:uncharacterized protein LOC141619680 isoform X3 n=1 Tax=Silene latifolia TaxID=37657 RepID=UPI003D7700EA
MEDGVGLGVLALVLLVMNSALSDSIANGESVSAVGDPCMRRDSLRVAFESWNFCNEVGQETPGMGSPRAADCFDLCKSKSLSANSKNHLSLLSCICFPPHTIFIFPQLFTPGQVRLTS